MLCSLRKDVGILWNKKRNEIKFSPREPSARGSECNFQNVSSSRCLRSIIFHVLIFIALVLLCSPKSADRIFWAHQSFEKVFSVANSHSEQLELTLCGGAAQGGSPLWFSWSPKRSEGSPSASGLAEGLGLHLVGQVVHGCLLAGIVLTAILAAVWCLSLVINWPHQILTWIFYRVEADSGEQFRLYLTSNTADS